MNNGMITLNDSNFEYTLNKYNPLTAIQQYNWTVQGIYDLINFINSNNITSQTNLQFRNTITAFYMI